MTVPDKPSLQSAFDTVLSHLLARMRPEGYWEGRLSSSALSTATALSALSLAGFETDREMIRAGVNWLAKTQCADGGWGDTPESPSNLSTTLLSTCALKLAGSESDAALRAGRYIADHAGTTSKQISAAVQAIYGDDRTFAVPILMNCALAGMVSWADVPSLPFEMAVFPRSWYKALRLQVVSYALPALIAVGLTIEHHNPMRNPLHRAVRRGVTNRVLDKLATLQPEHGGFLEATPLTCFVAMSLIPVIGTSNQVIDKCLAFARVSQRPDGSWPIDTNLSVWVTSGAVAALAASDALDSIDQSRTAQWLSARQYNEIHPFTGAAPGGWGWTHLPGAVPDADDTSGAILALSALSSLPLPLRAKRLFDTHTIQSRTIALLRAGVRAKRLSEETTSQGQFPSHPTPNTQHPTPIKWLLDLQNPDGGWPTFCRGWGKLPFDKSSPDITAHALRAFKSVDPGLKNPAIARAVNTGLKYLSNSQRQDGSWVPLWFGNQQTPGHLNPVFGTSRVLLALADWRPDSPEASKALSYLMGAQNPDGGWGGNAGIPSSIEESALALIALTSFADRTEVRQAIARGALYLIQCVKDVTWRTPSPIGLYFASLWYSEEMYPVIWTLEALGRMLRLRLHGAVLDQNDITRR